MLLKDNVHLDIFFSMKLRPSVKFNILRIYTCAKLCSYQEASNYPQLGDFGYLNSSVAQQLVILFSFSIVNIWAGLLNYSKICVLLEVLRSNFTLNLGAVH